MNESLDNQEHEPGQGFDDEAGAGQGENIARLKRILREKTQIPETTKYKLADKLRRSYISGDYKL